MSVKKYSIKTIFSQCKYTTVMHGFLLIEIMTAIALFSFAVLIIGKFCGQIAIVQREAQMFAKATTNINQMIEKIRIEGVLPPFNTQNDQITLTCLPWRQPLIHKIPVANANFLKKFEWIEIRASWKTAQDATQVLLVYTGVELL